MKDKEKEEYINNFMNALRQLILFWNDQEMDNIDRMEGLTHSILCILDGTSGYFEGDINTIAKCCDDFFLHQQFYKDDEK